MSVQPIQVIVLDHFAPVFTSTKRYVNMRGGRMSGKSHHAALRFLDWLLEDRYQKLLCVRKYAEHIERSQYSLLRYMVEHYGLQEHIGVGKSPMRLYNKRNDNEIVFAGVDDPEKLKSIANITKVWCEEPTELEESDLKTISTSLRGPQITDYPQIILTYNPISETHWLKARFWDNPPENSFNHVSTYKDNTELTQADIDEIESYKSTDPDYYDIIAMNKWGVIRTGQEYFHNFKPQQHVTDEVLEVPGKSVILAFDFNRLPYSTCLMIQEDRLPDGKLRINVFDEVCLPPPANTVEDIKDYIRYNHPWIKSVFYCGDPSGRSKGQRKSREEADSYEEQIEIAFHQWSHNTSNIFLRSAPPLAMRKHAMTELLGGNRFGELLISSRCKNLINDFQSLQTDRDGGYIKKKITNKETGATYEKGGHCMDALIYYAAIPFHSKFFPR